MEKKCKDARCKKSSEFNMNGYCNLCFSLKKQNALKKKLGMQMEKKCKDARCKKISEFDRCGYCNLCFLLKKEKALKKKQCLRCQGSNDFQYFRKKNMGLDAYQYHPFKIRYLCSSCIDRN